MKIQAVNKLAGRDAWLVDFTNGRSVEIDNDAGTSTFYKVARNKVHVYLSQAYEAIMRGPE